MRLIVTLLASCLLTGCVSLGIGSEAAPRTYHVLHDPASGVAARRAEPLLPALLIDAAAADASADSDAIAYSPRAHQFAFYQLASWAERPVRVLPRLLQRRIEARGVVAAVGILGEPLRADWLLSLRIDTLHHDVSVRPGQARLVVTAEIFERRSRTRVSRRQFEASAVAASADSAAASAALSLCVMQVFDALVPWLERQLPAEGARAFP